VTNIALVVLDTLRKDSFDDHFEWLEGRSFENARSTCHWTGPVHATLFTGRYPSEAGVYAHNRNFDYPGTTLVESLRAAGYTTRAFSSNVIVSPEFEFDRGFMEFSGSDDVEAALAETSVFDWEPQLRESQSIRTYLGGAWKAIRGPDETMKSLKRGLALKSGRQALDFGAQRCLDIVREQSVGENEFRYINLMEAHAPYYPPPAYRSAGPYESTDHPLYEVEDDQEIDSEAVYRAYDDCVRYLSETYRAIYAELRKDYDYVITVGDHGEMFGEHGYYEHTYGIFPEVTHVPLVISGPDVTPTTIDATVSLRDVYHTVLDCASVDDGSGRDASERSLLGDVTPGTHLSEYHGIPHPRQLDSLQERGTSPEQIEAYHEPKYAMSAPGGYYGYQTRQGYTEIGRPPTSNPEAMLQELLDARDVREPTEMPDPLGDSVLDQLEALGYA